MEKPCRAHLFSSEYNHHVYAKVSVLAYSFHILLGYEASLLLESLPFFQNCICYSAIFWHYGLRWFTLRPIKSHTCTIRFISGDMEGHWNVSNASCCLNSLTTQALCGLALSSIRSACQPMDDYQNGVQCMC